MERLIRCAHCRAQIITRFAGQRFCALRCNFWSKVNKVGPILRARLGRCWIWTAATRLGYGFLVQTRDGVQRRHDAHRLSWELQNGASPGALWVLHRCDNRSCVRPSHLFLGTAADNSRDCIAKDRSNRGERVAWSILTAADVVAMRAAGRWGTYEEIGAAFGVSKATAHHVLTGRTWRHV